ncbi:hypothetical protein BDY24DRAFT_89508 [Mrakia frigida]|uniref:zinc finger MYND domain-containing protein n=1 Tax=Mrakia frigida TaxID=29902 RepID=UPI003FCC103E
MAIPSSDILGKILGLSVDGIAADLSEMSKAEKRRLNLAVAEHFEFLRRLSEVQKDSYMAEFWSKFLPSLLRTLLAMEGLENPVIYLNVFCLATARRDSESAPFHRFVRNFPDEACAFYLKLWGFLEHICVNLDVSMEAEDGPGQIAKLLDVAFDTLFGLIMNLPASMAFPSLPPTTKIILRAVANRFDNEPRLRAPLEARGLWETFALDAVLHLVEFEEPRRHVAASGSDEIRHVWWSCEANRLVWTAGSDCSPCARLGDEEEMMACSRCLGVRYCSKEHQKADWKRHKLLCFKPTW